jgi:hypothetical protein
VAYHPVQSGDALDPSRTPRFGVNAIIAGYVPFHYTYRLIEEVGNADPWNQDVPDYIDESVNPYEPYSDDWYAWFGGVVPSGVFGPGAEECDPVDVYFTALALCCERSGMECDPTTTGVLYVFVDADCNVLDAVCYTVSDGTVAPTSAWGPVWEAIEQAIAEWLSGDDPTLGEENGVDVDDDNDGDDDDSEEEKQKCVTSSKPGEVCKLPDGTSGKRYYMNEPWPCDPFWGPCERSKIKDALEVLGPL